MVQFAFINRSIVPQAEATLSILDRGFLLTASALPFPQYVGLGGISEVQDGRVPG
jgi:hypothetical protein